MVLVKENINKHRRVYLDGDRYVKVWGNVTPVWIANHVSILNTVVPDYVIAYGPDWISYRVIDGIVANTLEHTDKFIVDIYKFCLDSISLSKPYVHGDWVLSNIIVRPDSSFVLIDWDNVGIYDVDMYMNKLHSDLYSAFNERFYDATKI